MILPDLIQDLALLVDAEARIHESHTDGDFLVAVLDPEGEPDPSLDDEDEENDPAAFEEIGRCSSVVDAVRRVVAHPRCPVDDVDPEGVAPDGAALWSALSAKYPRARGLRTARYRNFAMLQVLSPIEREELADDPYLWCVEKIFRGYRFEMGWTAVPPLHDVAFAILRRKRAASARGRKR